jgi:DHA1 family multidrug resistance protein-like MFS transporter
MALAASASPKHRIAFTIGAVQSALFLGTTIGPLFGGLLADTVGYRATFLIAGAVVIAAALLLLVFVQENFQRPVEPKPIFARQAFTDLFSLISSRTLAPLLGTMFIVQIAPMMMFTILPVLLVSFGQGGGATTTGVAFAILGITSAIAAYATGWLSSRMSLTKMLVAACVGAGIFYLPLMFVNSILPLYVFLGIGGIFQGVLSSSTNGLVGLMLPPEKQATGFGATQSTFALAIAIGPLIGAGIATMGGLRSVFPFQAAALLATAAIVVWLLAGRDNSPQPSPGSANEST